MEREYEIVSYPQIKHCNIFMLGMNYRSPHMHRDIEIVLLLEGSLEVKLERESYITDSPSIILLNPNQMHEILLRSESSVLLVMQLSPLFFADTYPLITRLAFDSTVLRDTLSEEDYKNVLSLFVKLGLFYFMKENLYEFSCTALLNTLFGELISLLPHRIISEDQIKAVELKARRISRILNFIDENFTSKILLSDIAERENLSLYYLSHFFKRSINQSFQEYINTLRFNHAKKLLIENKDMSLLDVCFQSGYSDYRYLQKAFVERFKCSPVEFRRNYRAMDHFETIMNTGSPSENRWLQNESLDYLNKWVDANKDFISEIH